MAEILWRYEIQHQKALKHFALIVMIESKIVAGIPAALGGSACYTRYAFIKIEYLLFCRYRWKISNKITSKKMLFRICWLKMHASVHLGFVPFASGTWKSFLENKSLIRLLDTFMHNTWKPSPTNCFWEVFRYSRHNVYCIVFIWYAILKCIRMNFECFVCRWAETGCWNSNNNC